MASTRVLQNSSPVLLKEMNKWTLHQNWLTGWQTDGRTDDSHGWIEYRKTVESWNFVNLKCNTMEKSTFVRSQSRHGVMLEWFPFYRRHTTKFPGSGQPKLWQGRSRRWSEQKKITATISCYLKLTKVDRKKYQLPTIWPHRNTSEKTVSDGRTDGRTV